MSRLAESPLRSGIADDDLGRYLGPAGVDYVLLFRRGEMCPPTPYDDAELKAACHEAVEACKNSESGTGSREVAKRVLLDVTQAHGNCLPIEGTEPEEGGSFAWNWRQAAAHLVNAGDLDLRLAPILAGQINPRQFPFGNALSRGFGRPGLLISSDPTAEERWIEAISTHYQSPETHTHRAMRLAHRQFYPKARERRASLRAEIGEMRLEHLRAVREAACRDQVAGRPIEWAKSVPGAWSVMEFMQDLYEWVETPRWLDGVADLCARGADPLMKNDYGELLLIWAMDKDSTLDLAARVIEAVPGIHKATPGFAQLHEQQRAYLLREGKLDAANACVSAIARVASQAPSDQAVPARKAVRPVIL